MSKNSPVNSIIKAVNDNNPELIRYLVQNGANILTKFKDGTYLHIAVKNKSLDAIKTLVELGIPVDTEANIETDDGKDPECNITPMKLAVQNEDLETMELLKDLGADILWEDCDAFSLMHEAAFCGKNFAIDWLLKNGLSIETKSNARNPLHLAAFKGHINTVKKLLNLGVDVNTTSEDGWTPLHEAAWGGHLDIIRFLIFNGSNINIGNEYGYTPLHWAAESGSAECVKELIKLGATVNIADDKGDTPLHWVAENGNFQICQILLHNGADINKTNNDLKTPLHLAVMKNNIAVVEELLNKGAEKDLKDKYNKIPIDYSAHSKMKNLLIN